MVAGNALVNSVVEDSVEDLVAYVDYVSLSVVVLVVVAVVVVVVVAEHASVAIDC